MIIYYFYEKVQKRCTECQRLTHARNRCPFLNNNRDMHVPSNVSLRPLSNPTLSEDDPLFGVLKEDQVGINPFSGRPRIAPEVLQEMRNYLLASSKEDRHVREHRVIFSVKEAEQTPHIQRTMLQLIPPPTVTKDLNKGKGIVFNYVKVGDISSSHSDSPKLMASAISAGHTLANSMTNVFCRLSMPTTQASSSQSPDSTAVTGSASLLEPEKVQRPL